MLSAGIYLSSLNFRPLSNVLMMETPGIFPLFCLWISISLMVKIGIPSSDFPQFLSSTVLLTTLSHFQHFLTTDLSFHYQSAFSVSNFITLLFYQTVRKFPILKKPRFQYNYVMVKIYLEKVY